jgi:phosphate/sulfate permease
MNPLVVLLMVVMSFFMGYAIGFNSEDDDF